MANPFCGGYGYFLEPHICVYTVYRGKYAIFSYDQWMTLGEM